MTVGWKFCITAAAAVGLWQALICEGGGKGEGGERGGSAGVASPMHTDLLLAEKNL
jgi:hypothetical protein